MRPFLPSPLSKFFTKGNVGSQIKFSQRKTSISIQTFISILLYAFLMNICPFWLNNHVVVMGLLALQGKITFPLPEILWMMEVPPHPHTHSCGGALPALHGNPFLNQWFRPFFRHQCFPVQQCYGGLGRVSPSHFPVQPLFDDAFPPLRMALFVQSAHATPDPTFVAWSRGPANM